MKKNDLIVKITDGFGNQLFQYAAAYSAAKYNNMNLYIDKSQYNEKSFRKYELNSLDIKTQYADAKSISELPVFKESSFNFDSNIFNLKSSVYIEGFWQSEKYFKQYSDDIHKMYRFKNMDFINNNHYDYMMRNSNSVAIHVRTQDYLVPPDNKIHYVCTKDYYKNAISRIYEVVKSPVFFVFSDNLITAQQFLDKNLEYIMVNSTGWQEDFYFMQQAKHNIIANSSFSWWAAWLNDNPDKIVIAPENWFSQNSGIDYSDVIPNDWVKVKTNC